MLEQKTRLKRSSYKIFTSVVIALFLREIQTRFGTKKLGYFWAVLDPMVKVIIFSLIYIFTGSKLQGLDFPVFLATSFLTYNFFLALMNNSMSAFDANRALFSYKQVKPIDTIISRFFIEFLVMCATIFIFICFGLYFNLDLRVKDFNMVILAVMWFGIFGLSIGILFAVINKFYETFGKIISFTSMPLFLLSALMYTVESLPTFAQKLILYNPIVHFIEMIHGNYFHVLDTKYVDYYYMMYWTIIPLFLGLLFYVKSEKKIIAS